MQEFIKENATIIVALIAAFVSVFTLLVGKIYEMKVENRKIKEEQYVLFLSNIAKVKSVDSKDQEALQELSVKIQMIYLIGDINVQRSLKEYLKIFSGENDGVTQSERYGRLIQAMKVDLYGRKFKVLSKKYTSLDEIELTVFK